MSVDIYDTRGKLLSSITNTYTLSGVNLAGQTLTRASLSCHQLRGTNFHRAIMNLALLRNADLQFADLSNAVLCGADLSGADLTNANLAGAYLTGVRLEGSIGVIAFGPVGDDGGIVYAVKHDHAIMIRSDCFWGTQAEAIDTIRKNYGENSYYEELMNVACKGLL